MELGRLDLEKERLAREIKEKGLVKKGLDVALLGKKYS
jgi:hypothetical protein